MFKDLIAKELATWIASATGNALVVNAPAVDKDVDALRDSVGTELPKELLAFYSEADGIWDEWYCFSIMASREAMEYNLNIRSEASGAYYASRSDHLAFSHADGSYYYFIRTPSGFRGIYLWDHETDERTFICETLEQWILIQTRSLQASTIVV